MDISIEIITLYHHYPHAIHMPEGNNNGCNTNSEQQYTTINLKQSEIILDFKCIFVHSALFTYELMKHFERVI